MNTISRIAVSLCCAVAAAGASGCGGDDEGSASAAEGGSITLGAIQMLTGSSAYYGQALIAGNELAVEEINGDGGLLGKQVTLVKEDNASDNAQTVNLARKLGQQDIAALVSPTFQPNNDAACAVSTSLGVPQIAALSPPPPAKVNTDGYCFMNTTDLAAQVTETIDFVAEELDKRKFAQIYDQQNGYQTTFNKVGADHIKQAGLELTADLGVDTGATDYGPQVTELIKSGAEIVMPNLTTDDAARFMKQARERGLEAVFVGPNAGLVNERLYTLSGGAAEGMIVSTTQSETIPSFKAFADAFRAKHGKLEDPLSGYGYDSTMLLKQAIEEAGSTEHDAIRDALLAIKETCASICYKADGKGNFYSTELYFQELTADGWKPVGDKVVLDAG